MLSDRLPEGGHGMTLLQIEYFLKTVETGSISKAAAELYISQPTISRSITALEREFGVQLLFREKTISLTGAGERFYHHARILFKAASELSEAMLQYKNHNIGSLRISYHHFDAVVSSVLLTCLKRLSEKAPNASIYMRSYSAVKDSLLGHQPECDLVFSLLFDVARTEHISYRKISADPVMAVFPASHPLSMLEEIRMADLSGCEILLPYSGNETTIADDPICQCFMHHGIRFDSIKLVSVSDQLAPMIIVDNGVALAPNSMVNQYHLTHAPSLCCRPVADCNAGLDIVVAWREDDPNPILRLFLAELEQCL